MKFLQRSGPDSQDDEEDMGYDSGVDSRYSVNLRAYSPSPKRTRGSLLDLFSLPNYKMGVTDGQFSASHQLERINKKKLSAREIDEQTDGEL